MQVDEDEVIGLPSQLPRELVEHGDHKTEVLSVQHAAALLRGSLSRADPRMKGFQEKRFHHVGLHQVEFALLKKTVDGDRDHVQPVTINVRVFPCAPHSIQVADSGPLSLRLGQRSNEGVRLSIEDHLHNPITPSVMRGWKKGDLCSFRLWCEEYPQLRVTADSDKLLAYEPRDQYQIAGLKIEPSEEKAADEVMLDFNDHRARLITCCAEFTIPAASEGQEGETIVVKHAIRLLPGEPQQLVDDFPERLTLTNSDPFPEFSLQYIDAFGKQTALTDEADVPQVSVWCDDARVEDWVVDKIAAQRMQINGSFKSDALQLPPFLVRPRALANIMLTNRQREELSGVPLDQRQHGEHTFTVHLRVEAGGEVKLHKECRVHLLARYGPSFLLVAQSKKAELVIDGTLQVEAKPNAAVALLLHCVDDGGYALPLDEDSTQPTMHWRSKLPPALRKAIRVNVSGLVDLIGQPYECGLNELDEDGLLPNVKMPRRIEDRRLECEVSVELDEALLPEAVTDGLTEEQQAVFEEDLHFLQTRLPLTASFTVHVQPGRPFQWSASVPPSLRCDARWGRTVQLFAVDRFGNRVSVPRSAPPPRIEVRAIIAQADDSKAEDTERLRADMADTAVEQSVQPQPSDDRRSEARDAAESVDEEAYQRVWLKNAEAVGVAEDGGDDDDVMVDEWSYFVCEKAMVIMQAGPASLTVYDGRGDDESALHSSNVIDFIVKPGEPKWLRVYLKDRTTSERIRLFNPSKRHEQFSGSAAERKESEAVEATSGLLILPVRMKFDQLLVSWLDRARNVIVPAADVRSQLVASIKHGALFELQDSGALQQGQQHVFHLTPLPELQGGQSVFPPFVCIYSKGANESEQWRAVDNKEDEGDYRDKRMQLLMGLTATDPPTPIRPLCNIELGLCGLPYSVILLDTITLYSPEGQDDLERYRALLNPAVISNLKLEEQDDSGAMILAGIAAPKVEVRLPLMKNESSLRYTLPPPDSSSLFIEWAYEGQRCLLRYQPAVYDEEDDCYTFEPVSEERKEGEQAEPLPLGEGVAPVGRFNRLDKAGKWSYCVTYVEKRPRLADVLTDRVKINTVIEEILPSIPHSLRLQRSDESNAATLPIVSNSDSGNRVVGRQMRLFIVDQYGSAVHLPLVSDALRQSLLEVKVVAQLAEDSSAAGSETAAPRRTPPQLRVEQPVLNTQLHCLDLPSITVVDPLEPKDADSGQYAVVFSLPEPYSDQFHCSLRFYFSNEKQLLEERRLEEQRRMERRQQLTQLLSKAQAACKAASVELVHTGQSMKSLDQWQLDIVKHEDGVLNELYAAIRQSNGQLSTNIDLDAVSNQLREWRAREAHSPASNTPHPFIELDQQLLREISGVLPARLINLPAVLRGRSPVDPLTLKADGTSLDLSDGFYGMLATFCTVEDVRYCQLISWHFKGKLGTYLVTSRNCNAKQVLDTNARRYHVNINVMYEEGHVCHPLPPMVHTRLSDAAQQTVTGRPMYVFSLLHFPERDERIRQLHQRVMQRVVSTTMVMTSMDDIRQYRKLLAPQGCSPPTILALRELKPWYADNTEQLGAHACAPPLSDVVPRMGVLTVSVERTIAALQQVREKVVLVNTDTAKLREQWAANRWKEREVLQRQALTAAHRQRAQLEADLRLLAEQVGQAAPPIAPASNVLLNRSVDSNSHRRRQAN